MGNFRLIVQQNTWIQNFTSLKVCYGNDNAVKGLSISTGMYGHVFAQCLHSMGTKTLNIV